MRVVARSRRIAALVLLLVLGAVGPLLALEKPTKAQIEKYRRDGTLAARIAAARALGNDQVDPALVRQVQQRLQRLRLKAQGKTDAEIDRIVAALPPGIHPGLPSKGTVKIFALLIDFSDYPWTVPPDAVTSSLYGDGVPANAPHESLRNYYRRSSYNQLEIQGATACRPLLSHSLSRFLILRYPSARRCDGSPPAQGSAACTPSVGFGPSR